MFKQRVSPPKRRPVPGVFAYAAVVLVLCVYSAVSPPAQAQDSGPAWSQLSASDQRVLEPLRTQWETLDAVRRQKWREIAQRYPKLPADQQERLRSRMAEWAAMTPAERNAARLRFEESKLLPADERQARWEAYQALPEDERKQLVTKAEQRKPVLQQPGASRPAQGSISKLQPAAPLTQTQPKSNIVPPKPATLAVRPIAPATVQATTGASTRPLTQRPAPPPHQQAGLPKVAATPELVDSRTLLPSRGPQGVVPHALRASGT